MHMSRCMYINTGTQITGKYQNILQKLKIYSIYLGERGAQCLISVTKKVKTKTICQFNENYVFLLMYQA